MARDAFYKLFLKEIKDIYSAENQIIEALPKMIDATTYPELREAFSQHLKETKNQVKRLDQIFSELGEEPSGEECMGMAGILQEGKEIIKSRQFPDLVKDAALISAAQRVEHYEIATYGTARTYAEYLDLDDIADLLQKNLDEEGDADKKLTDIAKGGFFTSGVNKKARDR